MGFGAPISYGLDLRAWLLVSKECKVNMLIFPEICSNKHKSKHILVESVPISLAKFKITRENRLRRLEDKHVGQT